jgi:hypothetical protein
MGRPKKEGVRVADYPHVGIRFEPDLFAKLGKLVDQANAHLRSVGFEPRMTISSLCKGWIVERAEREIAKGRSFPEVRTRVEKEGAEVHYDLMIGGERVAEIAAPFEVEEETKEESTPKATAKLSYRAGTPMAAYIEKHGTPVEHVDVKPSKDGVAHLPSHVVEQADGKPSTRKRAK